MGEMISGDKRPVVLIVLPNRPYFGASLVLVPALLHLRRCHPEARFIALANHGTSALFERWGLVDAVWRHDRQGGEPFTTFRRTLGLRPKVIVNFRPRSTRVHLWTLLLSAHERRCFAHGLGSWIDSDARPWDATRYKALTYLGLVGAGWQDHSGDLLSEWKFVANPVAPSGALMLIPSGGGPAKKWPLDRYLELANRWQRAHGGPVQVLAGPRDPEVVAWAATPAVKESGIVLVGGGLAAEAAAIRAAAMVVGNDCGPNHIAQLMDRPRVVLFKPTGGPGEWFRPGPHATHVLPPGPLADLPMDAVWDAVQSVSGPASRSA
jgi:ADP-heptose:LPS heptosyltransferase